jgi:hypothetical protein
MDQKTKDLLEQYVRKYYARRYDKKELMFDEAEKVYYVKSHKDESPLILDKKVIQ